LIFLLRFAVLYGILYTESPEKNIAGEKGYPFSLVVPNTTNEKPFKKGGKK
jgi:hypothetical protein